MPEGAEIPLPEAEAPQPQTPAPEQSPPVQAAVETQPAKNFDEVEFKAIETLTFGGETKQYTALKEAEEKVAVLRDETKPKGLKSQIGGERDRLKGTDSQFVGQEDELVKKFGLGKKEADLTVEEKRQREGAKKIISKLSSIEKYAQVVASATSEGKEDKPWESSTAKEYGLTRTKWETIRKTALDAIRTDETFHNLLDEDLKGVGGEGNQRGVIEDLLAKSPDFRAQLRKKLTEARTEIDGLTELEESQVLRTARKNKESAETNRDQGIDQVFESLKSEGIELTDEQENQIKGYLKQGKTNEFVLGKLGEELIGGEERFSRILEYQQGVVDYEKEDEWRDKHIRTQKGSTVSIASDEEKRQHDETLEKLTKQLTEFQTDLRDNKDGLRESVKEFETRARLLNPEEDGGLKSIFDQIRQSQKDITEAEKEITKQEIEQEPETKERQKNRLVKEQETIRELENVLPNALLDTLSDRFDQMTTAQRKVNEKRSLESQNELDKKITERLDKKEYIEYNKGTRQKIFHNDRISQDVLSVAYTGDDGVKRILIRMSELKTEDGTSIDWRTVDLDTLPDRQKGIIDNLFEKYGEQVKERLIASYVMSKNIGSLRQWTRKNAGREVHYGKLVNLKPHEWELLEKTFGGQIDRALEQSREAKGILKRMEAKGIKKNSKLKLLLFLLLGLFTAGIVKGVQGTAAAA